ncbi:endonuclease NucS [Haloarchaeobius sp. HME9146]|uniref:endonuclease NucS n=1 Tax=Haloarchaeobius sp. HME9146 TaxID=2978732 RepID=UPI0021C07F3C|nr:endonuclease NucS [Haloarchaeobius sp. HME9146]MCT9096260.1 endonuclease NucS [Haloarchaeobius sp. HME9146]
MTTERHHAPDAETVERVVREGLRDGAMISVLAECEVEYDGRSGGYLGPGDRMVVCKPDGTLLVHRPSGHKPVNWMPGGATIKVEFDESDDADDDAAGAPLLYARRSNPNEYLRVYLHDPYLLTRFDADDPVEYQERGTEAEMHEYIERNPETALEPGIRIVEHERETKYGFIDFFAKDQEGVPVVVEVKRRQATLNNFDQLKRYIELYRESNPEVRGMLVAPSASDRVKRALRDNGMEFVRLAEFDVETREASEKTLSDFF